MDNACSGSFSASFTLCVSVLNVRKTDMFFSFCQLMFSIESAESCIPDVRCSVCVSVSVCYLISLCEICFTAWKVREWELAFNGLDFEKRSFVHKTQMSPLKEMASDWSRSQRGIERQ